MADPVYEGVRGDEDEEYSPVGEREGYPKRRQVSVHTVLTCALGITSILLSAILFTRSYKKTEQSRWAPLPKPEQVVDTLVFGSCMKEDMPHPFWDTVADFEPQVTILAGDNVYMNVHRCSNASCVELQHAYDLLDAHPSFSAARKKLPMVAILDDHDYGYNDCSSSNPFKWKAKELFFDFYDIPLTDQRRQRHNEGLYTSYEWGPVGQRLQLILLDTRFSRSPFRYDDELWGYVAYKKSHTDKRILSKNQWSWLEGVLQRPANVRLIVSGIQVLSEGTWGFEHWALIPSELDRLKRLLQKYCTDTSDQSKSLPVLLSGDRHIGAFYHDEVYDLHEVTASSWTHTIVDGWDPDGVKCEGDECIEEDSTRVGDWVGVNHFGVVQVDWPKKTLNVSLVRAETSPGYPVKSKWHKSSDAGEVLKKLSLEIP